MEKWLIERLLKEVAEKKQEAKNALEWAYASVEKQYHPFIRLLDQSVCIYRKAVDAVPNELRLAGVWRHPKTGYLYITIRNPYMGADGRKKVFADKHVAANKKFSMTSNLEKLEEVMLTTGKRLPPDIPVRVRIESEIYGALEGIARIFWDDSGASGTNPLEVAYTSAVARAMGEAGIGILPTGFATYEEVVAALDAGAGKDADDNAGVIVAKVTPENTGSAAGSAAAGQDKKAGKTENGFYQVKILAEPEVKKADKGVFARIGAADLKTGEKLYLLYSGPSAEEAGKIPVGTKMTVQGQKFTQGSHTYLKVS
ncbi:hypothetical protein Tfer_0874 [Thermincola ferriacetica]|uniref:Uncharacterized protein n=1 Tax=Thermincola ferriacetica TaxID=281456 RepID=A0A0L6W5E2_9FIRM|nr:hypothetical protein [Thermincola ferriacetica]KNZ70314.1 hypothetical protein Tfer_0874 [Thermincola ferriacetica]